MNKKLDLWLGDIQTELDTAIELDGDDYLEVSDDASFDLIFENVKNNNCTGSFESQKAIIGGRRAECKLPFKIRSFGDTLPDWAKIAEAASFTKAESSVGQHTKFTLTPNLIDKAATIWKYNKAGETVKMQNMSFSWSIKGSANEPCILTLDGKGAIQALSAADSTTYTISKNTSPTPSIIGVTAVVFGSSEYDVLDFEFTSNQVIEQRKNGGANGYGLCEVTDRKIEFNITVYRELCSVVNPYTEMMGQTEKELSIQFGNVTGNKIKLIGEYANISDIKPSEDGNLMTYNITGSFNKDDFKIIINSDLTAL